MGKTKADMEIPEEFDSFETAKPRMREVVQKLQGLNFALLMELEGKFLLYRREHQPCYGEMRKYKKSHKDYTDPYTGREDEPSDGYRPGDLHNPFPKGTPVAVGLNFNFYPGDERMNRFMFSSKSPWIRGLPSQEFIEPIEQTVTGSVQIDDEDSLDGEDEVVVVEKGKMIGVILWETSFDPTVFVNLLNIRRSYRGESANAPYKGTYYPMLETMTEGMTELEILVMKMNFGMSYDSVMVMVDGRQTYGLDAKDVVIGGTLSPGYYGPQQLDVGMFCRQESHDLNGKKGKPGGTFKDRYDYNRKIFHEVFQDRDRRKGNSSVQDAYIDILSSSDTIETQIKKVRHVVSMAVEASFMEKAA